MEKVRINNDLLIKYTVLRDGLPESFVGATDITVTVTNEAYKKAISNTFDIVGNIVNISIDAADFNLCGKYRVTLKYVRGNDIEIDALAFEGVQYTSLTGGTEIVGVEIVTVNISGDIGIAIPDNNKIDLDGLNSNIDKLHFKPDTLVALAEIGDVRYSTESKTLEVKVSDTVSIQLGQEMQTRVKNDAGVQIDNGQMVYIDSAAGANPLAKLATTANADIAQRTFGMATENIANNGFGAITTEGLVRDVNTAAFTEGAMLWLGVNGTVTNIEPVAPTPKISVGMVLRSNVANGVIYVKIRAISRNQKLSDVYAPTLAGGDILRWNSTTLRFETFNITTALADKADLVGGKIPTSQLPSYVDDVLEYANLAAFPATGEAGKIYVALDTNLTYRWSGTAYVDISKSLALGETSSTAYRGDRGKTAYDHSQTTGNPHNTTAAQIPNTPAGTIAATTVQGAINELASDIVQVETDLNKIESDLNTSMLKDKDLDSNSLVFKNIGINNIGSTTSSSFNNSTDFVYCFGAYQLRVVMQTLDNPSKIAYYGLSFYDVNKVFISWIKPNINVLGVRSWEERKIIIPENAYYFRTSYWNDIKKVEYSANDFYCYIDGLWYYITKLENQLDGIEHSVQMYNQSDLSIKNKYINYVETGAPIDVNSVASDSTSFLPCHMSGKITVMMPIWAGIGVVSGGLGFFDEQFNYLSFIPVNRTIEGKGAEERTFDVPENAYYFRTSYWNEIRVEEYGVPEFYVRMNMSSVKENFDYIYSQLPQIENKNESTFSVKYTGTSIEVSNTKTSGLLVFPIIGVDTITGVFDENNVYKGGKIARKIETEDYTQIVTFDLSDPSCELQISTNTVYKNDKEVESIGINGTCSGDIGFIKDINVFVEGNPVLAGFSDSDKTMFSLSPIFGEMTSHYSKLEEVYYKKSDVKKGEVNYAKISILDNEAPLRLLNQPNGYNATFTFASHADRATVPITKAIFYGTDNEASPTYNTNGLLSYGIKGTMSVFAEGHTTSNAALDNASFKALIDDAYSKGIEIIPHTITYNPDTREGAERVLPFFKDNYNSRNWIDHYLRQDNPSIGHHSKGNDTESPHYIMDLMEQYGYDYSWCYIDTTPDGVVRNQLFEEHYQFRRDLLFKNKKLTFPDGTPMWQYKNTWKMFETIMGSEAYDEIEHIQNLIDTCNVWADHCYLTGSYGQLWKQEGSETFIDPKFDSMLSFVKNKKETGEIWNPTQSEFNDYMSKLLNLQIVRTAPYIYKVFSDNEDTINCSFLLKNGTGNVFMNGKMANRKITGQNFIFWGDIHKGENSIVIS